jgi:beta-galactosidase
MMKSYRMSWGLMLLAMGQIACLHGGDVAREGLPDGVKAVWDLGKAFREATPSRERICLNGLWRWQPAGISTNPVPAGQWGHFKVPGSWPGITDYMQKDCQVVFAHPTWKDSKLGTVDAAWYEREMTVPVEWTGRRIALQAECVNSLAIVYLDGAWAGEVRFPGGELDLTRLCRPGQTNRLSLLVRALPLKEVMLLYRDTANARETRGSVARRGLCGDVYLTSTPPGPRIVGVKVDTSVRRGKITLGVAVQDLPQEGRFGISTEIADPSGRVVFLTNQVFRVQDVQRGKITIPHSWKPDRLWDIHTPKQTFSLQTSLLDEAGKVVDRSWTERFGFREFWIQGRDFYLNGTRLYLSCIPFDNAQVGAAWASYEGARESFERLRSFGINFVYTHNYGCEPGSHLSFEEILRAADDTGMLVALSQPHFSHYDWKAAEADQRNGYAEHAESYVRMAGNHPSVVFYSMSHNATGYNEDMNPDMIDGIHDSRDNWSLNNVKLALRAEKIVTSLDPGRIVYHHASGNLSSLHAINFYPNFVPVQELSDWFEHWSKEGVKPVFLCEYGAPFTWDWTLYRGWYKGEREFGSAKVPWQFCLAEWNSQFLGDQAFQISKAEESNLRWEAGQLRAGNVWHRWDYPFQVGSTRLEERYPVFAMYLRDNWRAHRTWGVSANSPWEHGHFWKLRDGVNRSRQNLRVNWDDLQRPGFSADFLETRYERIDLAYEREDWIATPAAQALIRNNLPLLAYIGGKPASFTSKDHNFARGELVEKQIILINNSRESVTGRCEWSLNLPHPISGAEIVSLQTGEQSRVPVRATLPQDLAPGSYELQSKVHFSSGEIQTDVFQVDVLPDSRPAQTRVNVALWDPLGQTEQLFAGLGIPYRKVTERDELTGSDILVVGKSALTLEGKAPSIAKVREGLRVVLFEQSAEVLEKRFGFRVTEYGLRQVFPRLQGHPLLEKLTTENLRDWRGEATLSPPRLKYEMRARQGPTVRWCDIPVTRLWRCGNRGNVASVLIEKPARGDFMPILDGGFGLQYSPLMEYREGRGMLLVCQLDVTGRTEDDPAAKAVVRNMMDYVSTWRPPAAARLVYVGDSSGKKHLESLGIAAAAYTGGTLAMDQVLMVAPGGGNQLAPQRANIENWIKAGGKCLAMGLEEAELQAFLPTKVTTKKQEHIATFFEPFERDSVFAGVGPADVYNRDPRELPLVRTENGSLGNGVLGLPAGQNVVLCQLLPWQFDPEKQPNLKRTFRRASFLLSRVLANLGVSTPTPVLSRFESPVGGLMQGKRWLDGFYLDVPEEWDDPYRFFRW